MKVKHLITITLLVFASSLSIAAQTVISVMPSTDVTSESRTLVEADFGAHLDSYANGGYQAYAFRATHGIGKNMEIGANVVYSRNGASDAAEFQPNFKWKAYDNEDNGVSVSAGTLVFVPLNKHTGSRPVAMVYSVAGKRFKSAGGLKFTGGGYTMIGAEQDFGTKTGAMVGVEKSISKRVGFLGDWTSGKNRVGYGTAGLSFAVTNSQTLFVGYSVGNEGRANNGLMFTYGKVF
ncbi:MAG: hypothetical protein R2684_00035 [Pyrinomonadaceae bacterium]